MSAAESKSTHSGPPATPNRENLHSPSLVETPSFTQETVTSGSQRKRNPFFSPSCSTQPRPGPPGEQAPPPLARCAHAYSHLGGGAGGSCAVRLCEGLIAFGCRSVREHCYWSVPRSGSSCVSGAVGPAIPERERQPCPRSLHLPAFKPQTLKPT